MEILHGGTIKRLGWKCEKRYGNSSWWHSQAFRLEVRETLWEFFMVTHGLWFDDSIHT